MLIERAIILVFSKLKIPDLKSFTEKQVKYKSWKADIINKIEIDSEKYTNNKQRQAYIFNYLSNEG